MRGSNRGRASSSRALIQVVLQGTQTRLTFTLAFGLRHSRAGSPSRSPLIEPWPVRANDRSQSGQACSLELAGPPQKAQAREPRPWAVGFSSPEGRPESTIRVAGQAAALSASSWRRDPCRRCSFRWRAFVWQRGSCHLRQTVPHALSLCTGGSRCRSGIGDPGGICPSVPGRCSASSAHLQQPWYPVAPWVPLSPCLAPPSGPPVSLAWISSPPGEGGCT